MDKAVFQRLALLRLPGVGPSTLVRLIRTFGSEAQVLAASIDDLCRAGLPDTAIAEFGELQHSGSRSNVGKRVRQDMELVERLGASILCPNDDDYPQLLKEIHQPPPVLYALGDLEALHQPMLAIVGSRKATRSGQEFAFELAETLGQAGFSICSGLALGIDAAAHRGAVTRDLPTVAVTAVGIDRIYPARHAPLQRALLAGGGLVLTEFAPGTWPESTNFPRRNRIISGLCVGVIVVEASERSGSLITAGFAADQGREVFAVPGSVRNPVSRGCHKLLRDGACLVESAEDVLIELGISRAEHGSSKRLALSAFSPAGLAGDFLAIWQVMDTEPCSVDVLAQASGLPTAAVLGALTELELLGYVQCLDGRYRRGTQTV